MKGIFLEKVRREKNKSNKIWNKTNGPINIIGPFSYKNKKRRARKRGEGSLPGMFYEKNYLISKPQSANFIITLIILFKLCIL